MKFQNIEIISKFRVISLKNKSKSRLNLKKFNKNGMVIMTNIKMVQDLN